MKFKSNKIGVEIALCMTYFFSLPTLAEVADVNLQNDMQHTWEPYVAANYNYYSNLFLIPSGQPANQPGIDPRRSDSSEEIEGGVLYDQKFGLQEVIAHAKLSKTFFNHFTQLDYLGRDLLASLNWKIQSVLEGTIGATDTRSLGSYVDFHSQQRNLIDENRQFGTANWNISPHWRIHTGLSRDDSNYDLLTRQINDNIIKTEELGIDYLFLKGGSLGFLFRHKTGDFPNTIPVAGQNVSNSFSQNEYDAKLDWQVTGISRLTFEGGMVERTSDLLGSSNARGFNGRVNYKWVPDEKIQFNVASWRQFQPTLTGTPGYSLNTGISGDVIWDATRKLHFITKLRYEKRDFNRQVNAAIAPTYSDSTNNLSLQAKWEPRQYLHLYALISHDLRSATVPLGGYVGNGASIGAAFIF